MNGQSAELIVKSFTFSGGITTSDLRPKIGDFDGSGHVDFDDFFLFADALGKAAEGELVKYDLNNDGTIGFPDFFIFADNFGT